MRKTYIAVIIICCTVASVIILCREPMQCVSVLNVEPEHALMVSGQDLPSDYVHASHPVLMKVSRDALADDVFAAYAALLKKNIWRDVKLELYTTPEGRRRTSCPPTRLHHKSIR